MREAVSRGRLLRPVVFFPMLWAKSVRLCLHPGCFLVDRVFACACNNCVCVCVRGSSEANSPRIRSHLAQATALWRDLIATSPALSASCDLCFKKCLAGAGSIRFALFLAHPPAPASTYPSLLVWIDLGIEPLDHVEVEWETTP